MKFLHCDKLQLATLVLQEIHSHATPKLRVKAFSSPIEAIFCVRLEYFLNDLFDSYLGNG